MDSERLTGIITLSDIAKSIDRGIPLDAPVSEVMTSDVVKASSDIQLFEVISRFKEREIGRLVVVEEGRAIGILTQSDIIRVFPSL